ncbi:MAG: hypothetical protein IJK89_00355 [Clostridia bacterium]|nr:hypothetical protein [Clostridia bacterium]
MFRYKSVKELLFEERRDNERLRAALRRTTADLEYLAMMTDVKLDGGEKTEEDADVE